MKSYKSEVVSDPSGEWNSNSLRFETEAEAKVYVADLASRWVLVTATRVAESDDPVSARITDNRLELFSKEVRAMKRTELASAMHTGTEVAIHPVNFGLDRVPLGEQTALGAKIISLGQSEPPADDDSYSTKRNKAKRIVRVLVTHGVPGNDEDKRVGTERYLESRAVLGLWERYLVEHEAHLEALRRARAEREADRAEADAEAKVIQALLDAHGVEAQAQAHHHTGRATVALNLADVRRLLGDEAT